MYLFVTRCVLNVVKQQLQVRKIVIAVDSSIEVPMLLDFQKNMEQIHRQTK